MKKYEEQLKVVSVTNTTNVLVQIPAYIVSKWNLQKGDELNVLHDILGNTVIISKRV